MRYENQSLGKDTENVNKNKIQILEVRNTITKVKDSVYGLNSRTEGTKERFRELENQIEIKQSRWQEVNTTNAL